MRLKLHALDVHLHFESSSVLHQDLKELRVIDRCIVNRDLDPFLPFLFPLVLDDPIVLLLQLVGVRQLHSTDEVFAEDLEESQ